MFPWSLLAILLNFGDIRTTGPVSPEAILRHNLREKAISLRSYTATKGMDNKLFFLVDMTLPSGKKRFYAYDLEKDSIVLSGLVSHGRCNLNWLTGRKYSNKPGSGCTSLGKYKIGTSYQGQFGKAYRLYGLDSTNNNASQRSIVLHSHKSIPDSEVAPGQIAQSDGCPTVSPVMLQQLDRLLKSRKRPVLLYIYEDQRDFASTN